jgi:hypothetical protein
MNREATGDIPAELYEADDLADYQSGGSLASQSPAMMRETLQRMLADNDGKEFYVKVCAVLQPAGRTK